MEEVWKDIKGFEGKYLVSNFGRVKSMPNKPRPTCLILKDRLDDSGRVIVRLFIDGKAKNHKVSHLVWDAFGDKTREGLVVDHIDENKRNNGIDNLQLLTAAENVKKHFRRKRFIKEAGKRKGLFVTLDIEQQIRKAS